MCIPSLDARFPFPLVVWKTITKRGRGSAELTDRRTNLLQIDRSFNFPTPWNASGGTERGRGREIRRIRGPGQFIPLLLRSSEDNVVDGDGDDGDDVDPNLSFALSPSRSLACSTLVVADKPRDDDDDGNDDEEEDQRGRFPS